MLPHQSIQFIDHRAADRRARLPRKDFLTQLFSQMQCGLKAPPGPNRVPPELSQSGGFSGSKHTSGLEPAEQRGEVRQEFQRVAVLHRRRVEEVQRKVVSQKEETA